MEPELQGQSCGTDIQAPCTGFISRELESGVLYFCGFQTLRPLALPQLLRSLAFMLAGVYMPQEPQEKHFAALVLGVCCTCACCVCVLCMCVLCVCCVCECVWQGYMDCARTPGPEPTAFALGQSSFPGSLGTTGTSILTLQLLLHHVM